MEHLPVTRNGQFFAGISALLSSEERAIEAASLDAKKKARRWIQQEGLGDSLLDSLSDFRWCVQELPNQQTGGFDYLIQVLTYIPVPQ